MLRQNPYNPCQLLHEDPEGSGNWKVIFDLGRCNPNYIGSTFVGNDETKRCNIASLLTEVTLPDAAQAILAAADQSSPDSFWASLFAVFAAFATPGGVISVVLLTAAGRLYIFGLLTLQDISAIRAQIDNAYWLAVKQQLFCSMPDNGILTPQARQVMADSLNNIPNKERANSLVASILTGMTDETAQNVSVIGSLYDGSMNGCADCLPANQLLARNPESQLIPLGLNRWKLKVDVPFRD
jgi:hypothetical protein